MKDYVFGSLNNKGGNIRFTDVGAYTLIATAEDELGREYSCSQMVQIYPVIGLTVTTEATGHTDGGSGCHFGQGKLGWAEHLLGCPKGWQGSGTQV